MKKDHKKLTIGRSGGLGGINTPKGYNRKDQYTSPDELPKSEKMRQKWEVSRHCKEQDWSASPLRRFLRSRVGRKWDDVYSEICERVSHDPGEQRRVLDYLHWEVTLNTIWRDGVLCYGTAGICGYEIRDGFYVHPVTGILQYIPKKSSKQDKKEPLWYNKAKLQQFVKVNNLWYIAQLGEISNHENRKYYSLGGYYDGVLDGYHGAWILYRIYGGGYIGINKIKQCSGKEIKKFNLKDR
jgi:hypothetical protein